MRIDIRTRSEKASISRRTFLQFAAAGSAATLPAAALAAADGDRHLHLPLLSDQEQVDICIAQLKDVLGRMRPDVVEQGHFLHKACDGSYKLTLWSRVAKIEFDGDGFYQISQDGSPILYWVEKRQRYALNGRFVGDYFSCQRWDDGQPSDDIRQMCDPYFIRKQDGPCDSADLARIAI